MPEKEAPSSELGRLLRNWRALRGKSQLELSLDAGISQRHISFMESGRSSPSRHTLGILCQALGVPLRERNLLMLAAGYAPTYEETALDGPEMAVIKRAVERMLLQQEPYPALVLNRYWQVVMTNDAAPRFFEQFVDLAAWPRPRNLLHLMFDPEGVRPFVENWERVAAGLLERVRREAVERAMDEKTAELLRCLERYPGVPALKRVSSSGGDVVVPIIFRKDGQRWPYFSLVSTVGTPNNIAAQELRIECMFPA